MLKARRSSMARLVSGETKLQYSYERLAAWRAIDLRQNCTRSYKRMVRRMRRKYRRIANRREIYVARQAAAC